MGTDILCDRKIMVENISLLIYSLSDNNVHHCLSLSVYVTELYWLTRRKANLTCSHKFVFRTYLVDKFFIEHTFICIYIYIYVCMSSR